jgi:hypothetical protein
LDGVNCARELRQDAVARRVRDPPIVLIDLPVGNFPKRGEQASVARSSAFIRRV